MKILNRVVYVITAIPKSSNAHCHVNADYPSSVVEMTDHYLGIAAVNPTKEFLELIEQHYDVMDDLDNLEAYEA